MLTDGIVELLYDQGTTDVTLTESLNQMAMVVARHPGWLMDELNLVEPSGAYKALDPVAHMQTVDYTDAGKARAHKMGITASQAEPLRIAPPDRPTMKKITTRGFSPKGAVQRLSDISGLSSPQAKARAAAVVDETISTIRGAGLADEMARDRIQRITGRYDGPDSKRFRMLPSLDDAKRAQDVVVQGEAPNARFTKSRLRVDPTSGARMMGESNTFPGSANRMHKAFKTASPSKATKKAFDSAKVVANPMAATNVRYSPFDVLQARVATKSALTPMDTLRMVANVGEQEKISSALQAAAARGLHGDDAIKHVESVLGSRYTKNLKAVGEGMGGILQSNPIGVGTKGAKSAVRGFGKTALAATPVLGSAIDLGMAVDEALEGDYDDALGHVLDAGIGLVPGADLVLNAPVMLLTDYDGAGSLLVDIFGGDID